MKMFQVFYHENASMFQSNASSFTILSCSAVNSAFVARIPSFVFKSEFPMRLEISDLWTNFFFILESSA